MRAMRVMRASANVKNFYLFYLHSCEKVLDKFFLCCCFFFFRFCYNFGENFAYSKSPKLRKKIKTIRKNLLSFKTSEKKNRKKTYGCTATRIGIY